MKYINNSQIVQRGFAVAEGVLIFAVIAIIAGTGYYVWNSTQATNKNLDNAAKSSSSAVGASRSTSVGTGSSANNTSLEIEAIAVAIANDCKATDSSVNEDNLKAILLKTYKSSGNDQYIVVADGYARASMNCDDKNSGQGGGAAAFLKKEADKWTIKFITQQELTCEKVEGQGWPKSILAQCYDITTSSDRAPK
jgi:hypothetical protein